MLATEIPDGGTNELLAWAVLVLILFLIGWARGWYSDDGTRNGTLHEGNKMQDQLDQYRRQTGEDAPW